MSRFRCGPDRQPSAAETAAYRRIGERFSGYDSVAVAAALAGKETLLGDWLKRQLAELSEAERTQVMERLRRVRLSALEGIHADA